jgi:IS1 family transposase
LGVEVLCPHCNSHHIIKNGKNTNGKQRYKCKDCKRRFLRDYGYKAYLPDTNKQIIQFTKEGLGIRSTARVLQISTTTLLKRIIRIANSITKPTIPLCRTYEVDELSTFVGKKDNTIWLAYALEREQKEVVSFNIGRRTNLMLSKVIIALENAMTTQIYTDKLNIYQSLIPEYLHNTSRRNTNHIERNNLTLRNHIKRLGRKTICFSRSFIVLFAVVQIYFWG